jgi:hypothetical protein
MAAPPPCRTITVVAFRGDRTALAETFEKALENERDHGGARPGDIDCLLYAGHTGVSIDGTKRIFGFNPDGGVLPLWLLLDRLKNGDAFPGVVRDDTAVFASARRLGLPIITFDVILPDMRFREFRQSLMDERKGSQFTYGFPNGDGDCNCTTWLERLSLPLLTGRMSEFVGLSWIPSHPSRKFGQCV